ncbi:MAG: HAD family hydrolase [Syntrophobacteraceae bacterium]
MNPVSNLARRSGKPAAQGPGSAYEGFCKLLPLVEVVSFDIFDTLLLRKTRRPTDVFVYMESEARKILDNPGAPFSELRVNAEAIARRRALEKHDFRDTNLEEIYSVLGELTGVDESALKALIELEMVCEQRLIYANPDTARLFDLAGSQGKSITFTSDMYLPRSKMAHLLQVNGFCAENLLISSEARVTKHGGELFDLVIDKFGGDPANILHIGDNEWSDFQQARRRGLQALHWRPRSEQIPFVDQGGTYAANGDWDLSSSIYTGLARKRRLTHPLDCAKAPDFWKAVGYELIGPLYLSFVTWTIRQARQLDVDKLFFLARDGYYLSKVFAILKERWRFSLDADYIYASRRLLNLPRIRAIDADALAFLTEPNPCMCLGDFFERIGLDPAAYSNRICDFGLTSFAQVMTTAQGAFISDRLRDKVRRLIVGISGDILAIAAQERDRLLSYLTDTGIGSASSAIVDIGWQASSIKSLCDLLTISGEKPRIHGLYFSTWRFAENVLRSGCRFESFYVHLDNPQHRTKLIREGVEVLESFFCAPHPSVVGVVTGSGGWRPLYGVKEVGDMQQGYLDLAREAALEFVTEATDLVPDPDFGQPAFAYLDAALERLLRHPLPHEAQMLGELSHRNSFGGNGPLRYVAKPPPKNQRTNRAALREAYERCYWKTGFWAQLTATEKRLLKRKHPADWDAYDKVYHIWKEYRKKRIPRHDALAIIDERYGLALFVAFYPVYKALKPFRNLLKSLKKRMA